MFYSLRHGESTANLLWEFSNNEFKHPLTEKDVEQAHAVSQRLSGLHVAQIFSSPVMRAVLRLEGRDPHHFSVNRDVDLASIAAVSFPITARIDYAPVAAIRDETAACHASQGGGQMGRGLQGWIMRLFRGDDTYMRAHPEPRKGERPEVDLFAGV